MDLTIFEVHLDGSTFNAPFSSDSDPGGADSGGEEPRGDGGAAEGGSSGLDLRPLVVLLVLLGLALLARYLRSDEGSEEPEPFEVGEDR